MPKLKNSNETFWVIFKQCVLTQVDSKRHEKNINAILTNFLQFHECVKLSNDCHMYTILWIHLGLFKVCTLFLWQISPRHSWQCMQFPGIMACFSASNLPLLWHFVVAVTYFANWPFHTLSPCSVILSLGGPTFSAVKTLAAWRRCREESYRKMRKVIKNICFLHHIFYNIPKFNFFLSLAYYFPPKISHFSSFHLLTFLTFPHFTL